MFASLVSLTTMLPNLRSVFSLRRVAQWLPCSGQAPRILLTPLAWYKITNNCQHSSPPDKALVDECDECSGDLDDFFTSTTSSISESGYEEDRIKYVYGRQNLSCHSCRSAIERDGDTLHSSREQFLRRYFSESDESHSFCSSDRHLASPTPSLKHRLRKQTRSYRKNCSNRGFSHQNEKILPSHFHSQDNLVKRFRNGRKYRPSHANGISRSTSASESVSHSTNSCDRINTLERELAALRSQLAQLIVVQEGKQACISREYDADTDPPATSTPDRRRPEADGESDAATELINTQGYRQKHEAPVLSLAPMNSCSGRTTNTPTHPIPPPPPPPPLLPLVSRTPSSDWRSRLIEAKRKKEPGSTNSNSPVVKTTGLGDMQTVLQELQAGGFKLRSIARSPGGTPVRQGKAVESLAMDPGSIISRALKNKLLSFRAALESSCSGEISVNSSLKCDEVQNEQSARVFPLNPASPPISSACPGTPQSPINEVELTLRFFKPPMVERT